MVTRGCDESLNMLFLPNHGKVLKDMQLYRWVEMSQKDNWFKLSN